MIALAWFWATLVVIAFLSLSLLVMAVVVYTVRRIEPPTFVMASKDERELDAAPKAAPPVEEDESEGWREVGVAPDQIRAETWATRLGARNIRAIVRQCEAPPGVDGFSCRVLVPEERFDEAMDVLRDLIGRSMGGNQETAL